ncbi:hypothetical protein EVAR_24014_1 [Eumeta japonica]|uniref:Uncharacterized protein n=1 Tax=Eumeta variegata TaxID=151549 RepID=A0A4C1WC81_EUMVA|nr:hypothetical protein EVAR_24014_1 [Eumeta japonica]
MESANSHSSAMVCRRQTGSTSGTCGATSEIRGRHEAAALTEPRDKNGKLQKLKQQTVHMRKQKKAHALSYERTATPAAPDPRSR